MKNQNVLEIFSQVGPLIGTQNTKRKTDEGPQVNHRIIPAVMLTEFMYLGVAVVTAGDTVIRAGYLNLVILLLAELQALFLESGLQEAAAAAATIIVGPIGLHIDKIFFPHHGFDHEAQIFGNWIPIALAHDLTGVLDRKLNFQILVPVGIDLELSFADPFGIIFIDIFDDEIMLDVEFFQSCQD
jgi:hypothetical protein